MSFDPHDPPDAEFRKLLTRRTDVDLTRVALEIARDAQPGLDFQPTLDWIDARAAELAGPVARARTERDALEEIGRCLAERHGIFGDPDSYERDESSFLNRVIETKRGIPISLGVLYMAVAERLKLELRGVAAPMHFLTRYDAVDGPLFLDGFTHGRILTAAECLEWLHSISRVPHAEIQRALRPVDARAIVIRMLNNLKALYFRSEQWDRAWVVQQRLTALQPAVYRERRDLALLSVRAGRCAQAVELLEACLRVCPQDEREVLQHHLAQAQGQLARWN